MSSKRLFVVVSTGQNVSNLPPLLEHAEEGDQVVWIESAEARRRNWSEGTRGVLTVTFGLAPLLRNGAPVVIEVEELDDLAALNAACKAAVEQARSQGLRPHLILNGGPKLTPLGLLRAWAELNPVLLYGEDRPAVCKTFPSTLDRQAQVQPYTRHTLDLPQILEVSGHQIHNNEGISFWPGPLADDLAREPYGTDAAYTVDLHARHHLRKDRRNFEPFASYQDVQQIAADCLDAWKQTILTPLRKRGLALDENEDGVFELIYTRTLGLIRNEAAARRRANQTPIPSLWDAFERAVARRVHAWLEKVRHPAIQSAWRGVKVASRREPDHVQAEFDILLVLKNGVLWHLECKSFTADVKDLDARVFKLQQAGSLRAQMALCGPLFTGHVNEPWFAAQHDLRTRIEARRHLGFIPFTLPGQPDKYDVEEAGTSRTFACRTLEDALTQALGGYRLASRPTLPG